MDPVNEQTPAEQQPAAPVPGTPEHDQAMAAKYQQSQGVAPEGQPSGEAPAPAGEPSLTIEKPEAQPEGELIGGKFKSTEELLAAYEELAAKQTPEGQPEGESNEAPAEEAPALSQELFDKAAAEYDAGGDITAETREALTKAGIPPHFIDTYVEGVKAQSRALVAEAQSLVGGEDNWNAMMSWAKGLPEAEIEAFNKAVTDPATSSLAIQGLYARFAAQNGSERPSAISGAERGALNGDVYRSKQELTADMSDPRYGKDSAFTQSVTEKLRRSRQAGTIGPFGAAY